MSEDVSAKLYDRETALTTTVYPHGTLRVADLETIFESTFEGSAIDSTRWSATNLSATTTVSAGIVTLATTSGSQGVSSLFATERAHYIPNTTNVFHASVRLGDNGVANNIRRWGAFDADDGFFFELSGTSVRVVSRKEASDTAISSASFSNAFVLDTRVHSYDIWYGPGRVFFFQDRVLIASISADTTLPVATLHLKAGFDNRNTGGLSTNQTLEVRSVGIARAGLRTQSQRSSQLTGRTYVRKTLAHGALTTAGTTIHTVTAGKRFYLTAMAVSTYNNATAAGHWEIRDTSATTIMPFSLAPKTTVTTDIVGKHGIFGAMGDEPLVFSQSVQAVLVTGTITASIMVTGYEERV